ncbi:DUF6082 family protein [Streptomyces sp. NPDC001544]|uniref:DUF6082 family protein n=1 Tax=Streptomyces sp. NPDC001544 TaxID=3364584 RepID=UPI00367FF5A2
MAIGPRNADWEKLSQISQAYGALSVVLSAGALAGVAASLAYQARQTRIATEETTWTAHRELLLLSLANTEFLTCWEPPSIAAGRRRAITGATPVTSTCGMRLPARTRGCAASSTLPNGPTRQQSPPDHRSPARTISCLRTSRSSARRPPEPLSGAVSARCWWS